MYIGRRVQEHTGKTMCISYRVTFLQTGKQGILLANGLSCISRMAIKFIIQSGTLLKVKGDSINNYIKTAGINRDCPGGKTGQVFTLGTDP